MNGPNRAQQMNGPTRAQINKWAQQVPNESLPLSFDLFVVLPCCPRYLRRAFCKHPQLSSFSNTMCQLLVVCNKVPLPKRSVCSATRSRKFGFPPLSSQLIFQLYVLRLADPGSNFSSVSFPGQLHAFVKHLSLSLSLYISIYIYIYIFMYIHSRLHFR